MLGSFMEEMHITPEQFEVACLAGKHNASGLAFHQGLFQQVNTCTYMLRQDTGILSLCKTNTMKRDFFQFNRKIWAANDIRIFIRMMIQRNVELQLQALDMIERKHFNSTASSSMDDPDIESAIINVTTDPNEMANQAEKLDEKTQENDDEELDDVIQEEMK